MWPGDGAHMGWMGLWWLLGIALLVLVVWAIARAAGGQNATRGEESPETTLKRRYARGEIDRDEYERQLSDLRK
jgi:putative membrane protein